MASSSGVLRTLESFVLFKAEMVLQAQKENKDIKVTEENQAPRDHQGTQWFVTIIRLKHKGTTKRPLEVACLYAGGVQFVLIAEELFLYMKVSNYTES